MDEKQMKIERIQEVANDLLVKLPKTAQLLITPQLSNLCQSLADIDEVDIDACITKCYHALDYIVYGEVYDEFDGEELNEFDSE